MDQPGREEVGFGGSDHDHDHNLYLFIYLFLCAQLVKYHFHFFIAILCDMNKQFKMHLIDINITLKLHHTDRLLSWHI